MLSNIDFGSYFHTKKYEKGLSTGGDKIADWGGSKGGWGGHVPPSLYVKRGPALFRYTLLEIPALVTSNSITPPSASSIFPSSASSDNFP